jgi:hypothetical protein
MPTTPSVIESGRLKNTYQILTYPLGGSTHGMIMNFYDYKFRSGSTTGINPIGSLSLPLPQNIADVVSVNIKNTELGIMGAGIADIATGGSANLLQAATEAAREAGVSAAEMAAAMSTGDFSGATGALTNASSAALFAARAGLTSISPSVGDALSASSGTAVNPHATLIFDGVLLKKFNFTWQFAPKSNAESAELHRIIKTVRKNILPSYLSGGGDASFSRGILNYPKMVDFAFFGIDPNRIFRFKRSMIDTFNVDYSPNGNVMSRGEGAGSDPAFININIGFTESEIWTSEDYE